MKLTTASVQHSAFVYYVVLKHTAKLNNAESFIETVSTTNRRLSRGPNIDDVIVLWGCFQSHHFRAKAKRVFSSILSPALVQKAP